MVDERIYTGRQAQIKLNIDDRKLVNLAEYFEGFIDGFGAYVGPWRRYTEREIELMRYFLREKDEFDVDALISKRGIDLLYRKG